MYLVTLHYSFIPQQLARYILMSYRILYLLPTNHYDLQQPPSSNVDSPSIFHLRFSALPGFTKLSVQYNTKL